MFIYNQVSLGTGETLVAKQAFETVLKSFGFSVSNYHGDNGVFNSQAFKNDCKSKQQQLTFSGSGAHHQNGMAERLIGTFVRWARTLLLHAAIHWLTVADLKLWHFALQHAVYLWNILPEAYKTFAFRTNIWLPHPKLYTSSVLAYLGLPYLCFGSKITGWKETSKMVSKISSGLFCGIFMFTFILC